MNRTLLLNLTLFSVLFITACQKEPDESIIQQPTLTCQLKSAIQFDETGDVVDTAGYVYTNSKVTRIERVDTYNTMEYSGDRIVKRNYFQRPNTSSTAYDNITYNADGTPSKVEFVVSGGALPVSITLLGYEFVYAGGKLTGFVEKVDTSFSGKPLVTLYSYQYTYTGNNITSAVETYVPDGTKDTLVYQFASTNNYFKQIANVLFTDVLFAELNGQTLPFAVSANNITAITVGGDNFPVAYNLDTNKNLSELLIGGVIAARYSYTCK